MRMSAFLLAMLIPATAGAQYYQTDFPAEEFKGRHAKVFERIGDNAVAVVQGVPQTEGFTLPRQHNTSTTSQAWRRPAPSCAASRARARYR